MERIIQELSEALEHIRNGSSSAGLKKLHILRITESLKSGNINRYIWLEFLLKALFLDQEFRDLAKSNGELVSVLCGMEDSQMDEVELKLFLKIHVIFFHYFGITDKARSGGSIFKTLMLTNIEVSLDDMVDNEKLPPVRQIFTHDNSVIHSLQKKIETQEQEIQDLKTSFEKMKITLENLNSLFSETVAYPSYTTIETDCLFIARQKCWVHIVPANIQGKILNCKIETLQVTIRQHQGNREFKHKVIEDEGRYKVEFTPDFPGLFTMVVKLRGENIQGSPFTFNILGESSIVIFGSEGTAAGRFKTPWGICYYDDDIYVIDSDNQRIQVFKVSGRFIRIIDLKIKSCPNIKPMGICVDRQGLLCVSDTENDKIHILDRSGALIRSIGSSGNENGMFDFPLFIRQNKDGRFYVTDWKNNRVQIFDERWNYVSQFGISGKTKGRFTNPTGIAFTKNGCVVVADDNNRVQIFDESGYYISEFGSLGNKKGEFNLPSGIAVDHLDRIFITDQDNRRVQVFSISGNFIHQFDDINLPHDLCFTPKGNLIVTCNHHIQVY